MGFRLKTHAMFQDADPLLFYRSRSQTDEISINAHHDSVKALLGAILEQIDQSHSRTPRLGFVWISFLIIHFVVLPLHEVAITWEAFTRPTHLIRLLGLLHCVNESFRLSPFIKLIFVSQIRKARRQWLHDQRVHQQLLALLAWEPTRDHKLRRWDGGSL